jgi:hypothetical protein
VVRIVKSRRLDWAAHVVQTYIIFPGKPARKQPPESLRSGLGLCPAAGSSKMDKPLGCATDSFHNRSVALFFPACFSSFSLFLLRLAVIVTGMYSCAMVQAVSHQPLTAEAQIHTQVNPCGSCGGQNGIETGLSPSSSVNPVSIIPPWFSILIYLVDKQ